MKRMWWQQESSDETDVTVCARLPESLVRAARVEARRRGCTVSALLTEAIVLYASEVGVLPPPESAA